MALVVLTKGELFTAEIRRAWPFHVKLPSDSRESSNDLDLYPHALKAPQLFSMRD